jgi:hypothetical protein
VVLPKKISGFTVQAVSKKIQGKRKFRRRKKKLPMAMFQDRSIISSPVVLK